MCSRSHRKHPLQRWDREGPFIETDLGFHQAFCRERPLLEPPESLIIDHFPFREESVTRRRLGALWGIDGDLPSRATRGHFTSAHMEARVDSLDAVYAGEWERVRNFDPSVPPLGVSPVDWRELEPPISRDVRRWGDERDG
jgi:hypothetical protein